MIQVKRVETALDQKRFVSYPYEKYKGDSAQVLPLKTDAFERFRESNNPFLEHARMELFLAERSGSVVGRVAVIDDDFHNDIHHENLLFFGFFEAETQEVAQFLMAAVEKRAQQLGRGRIRGPVNPSMHEGAGFQVDAFHSQPYIMTNQNPEAYLHFIESLGYTKAKDLLAWKLSSSSQLSLSASSEDLPEYKIRSFNLSNYDADFKQVFDFYNENRDEQHETWGQIPLGSSEVQSLADGFKDFLDPNMILFLELESELAAVAFGLPNENQVLAKLEDAKVFPLGWWYLLIKKRLITSIRLSILEVSPKYKGKGLELILLDAFYKKALELGYTEMEFSYSLEDNESLNEALHSFGAEQYKRFRLYQKNLIDLPFREKGKALP